MCIVSEWVRERESYLHILVDIECVTQIMDIHIHETVENVNIWGDLLSK